MEDIGGFLTGDMEDRVITDIMNHGLLPQGRYPENFVLIYQLEMCQEGWPRRGYLEAWRHGDMEDRVIPDVLNDVILP